MAGVQESDEEISFELKGVMATLRMISSDVAANGADTHLPNALMVQAGIIGNIVAALDQR